MLLRKSECFFGGRTDSTLSSAVEPSAPSMTLSVGFSGMAPFGFSSDLVTSDLSCLLAPFATGESFLVGTGDAAEATALSFSGILADAGVAVEARPFG